MIKRCAMRFVLLGVLVGPIVAFHGTVAAAPTGASAAASLCRELHAGGFLVVTVGECVNLVRGPASDNATSFVAALCGVDFIQQEIVGTTNKGECIQAIRSFSG